MTSLWTSRIPIAPCLLLVAACTAHPSPVGPVVTGTSGGEVAHHGPGGGHHAPAFPPGPVADMQAVLRPVAHGNVGPDRDARICAQAETLRQRAGAIAAGAIPAQAQPRSDAWRAGTARLTREADALVAECAGTTRTAVFERLEALHVAFHDLTEDLTP